MNTITVRYFASLREHRGLGEETLATAATTPAALYTELRTRHGFALPLERVRAVLNEELVRWDAPLRAGDRVAFLPPVAGG
jgi:molybdopterin synthase sulfur carrier subunit